ncbi:hypothetical protein [Nitrosopumilus sp. Nsub]|uniref:coiled-coil domain-containing protein n=1 Tax=Nitrosopumilus sp. Nsub TaxID=1776294 RepID=UPI000836F1D7|nr:hypothetical protein [Nitrosopumilus sp. Nsub]
MVLPLDKTQKTQILDLHYSGHTNDEIHNIIGRATGSVSEVITNYTHSLESDDHDSIISLSRSWKKNGLSVKDASTVHRTCGILKKNGLDVDNLPDIAKMVAYVNEKKISISEFIDSSKQLMDIQEKLDISLCDVPEKIIQLKTKCESLEAKSTKLEKDITLQDKTLQDSIESKNTTIKQLDDFTETRGYLKKSNIDVDDLQKVGNMLKSADTQKYDLSKIASNLQKEDSASNRITQLELTQKDLSAQIKSMDDSITAKQSQMDSLNSKYDDICKDHDKKKKEIASIASLAKSGVSSSDIKSWDKIISETSIDVSQLAESLDSVNQLSITIQSLKDKENSLKNDAASLQGQKSQLNAQVKKLKSTQDEMLKLNDEIKQIFSDAVSYSLNNSRTLSQRVSQNYFKDLKELFEQQSKHMNKLASQLEKRVHEMLSQDEKIIQHTKILNDVNFLLPLYEMICGKYNHPRSQVLAVYSAVTSALINWCISENISHTPFAKSLEKINDGIKLLLSGTASA